MVILNVMKNMFMKFFRDLSRNIYRSVMRLIGYSIAILLLAFCATRCAKALTISDNLLPISDSQLNYLKNVYERSNYKNYVITSNRINNNYNTITYYYLCLTNDDLDLSSATSLTSNCNEFYRYNSTNNNYEMIKLNDTELILNNSVYYSSYFKNNIDTNILIIITIILSCFFLIYFLGCLL